MREIREQKNDWVRFMTPSTIENYNNKLQSLELLETLNKIKGQRVNKPSLNLRKLRRKGVVLGGRNLL